MVENQQSGKISECTGLKCMITEFFPLFRTTILQHLTMPRTLSGRVTVTGGTGSLVFVNHVTADSRMNYEEYMVILSAQIRTDPSMTQ